MNENDALIRVKNLTQSFTVGEETIPVIHTTSFDIPKQSLTIIYGPSGSGKSTLLNILGALQPPTTGTVTFNGTDIYSLSADDQAYFRASELGVVYQHSYWVNSLSVLENVAIPLSFLGYQRDKAHKVAMEALYRVDMAKYAKKSPVVLSGGEQQRVSMARAIINDPQVIIADEPTGNLDTRNGDMMMALLASYKRDLKRNIILVTHNIEYLALADYLIHIHDGTIEVSEHSETTKSTEGLIDDMRARMKRLSKVKNHA